MLYSRCLFYCFRNERIKRIIGVGAWMDSHEGRRFCGLLDLQNRKRERKHKNHHADCKNEKQIARLARHHLSLHFVVITDDWECQENHLDFWFGRGERRNHHLLSGAMSVSARWSLFSPESVCVPAKMVREINMSLVSQCRRFSFIPRFALSNRAQNESCARRGDHQGPVVWCLKSP